MKKREIELSAQYLRMALPLMAHHEVAVTPKHYAVWYDYVAGTNPELREQIDRLVNEGKRIDDRACDDLYNQYVLDFDEKRYQHAQGVIARIVDQLGETAKSAGGDISRYQLSLSDCSKRLSGKIAPEVFNEVVKLLTSETDTIFESSRALQIELAQSKRETESLKAALVKARYEATIDPLTGLLNRNGFEAAMERLLTLKSGQEHCLLLSDIDNFKSINDTHGHLVGDNVIKFVANTIKNLVKGKDAVGRFGGEEFAVLLPATPITGAAALANSIRQAIATEKLVKSGTKEPIGCVTISIGVASYRDNETFTQFIERADEALYAAKRSGRNRVVSAGGADSATGTHG